MHNIRPLTIAFLAAMAMTACLAPDDGAEPPVDTAPTELAPTIVFQTGLGARTCDPPHLVAAAPGEEGQWAAVRVGHTTGVFRPTSLRFILRGASPIVGSYCAGNAGPFKVRVFYGPAATPPANPTVVVETIIAPGAGAPTETRTVDVDLRAQPIPANQSIFVAVEMIGDPATDTGYNCVAGCGPRTRSANWWSLATGAPYGWVELGSLGSFPFDIGMRVEGFYQ